MRQKGEATFCRICGKMIPYSGKGAPGYYCSDECKKERNRRCGRASYAKRMAAERAAAAMEEMSKQKGRHLDYTLMKCGREGISYAEAQKRKTLAMLPKISLEV